MTMSWAAVSGFLVTLLAVYSPLAAAPSYSPVVGHFDAGTRRRISLWLFVIVAAFVVAAVWVGELVVEALGVSTTVLSAVGGIALLFAGIPMMRGIEHVPPEDPTDLAKAYEGSEESWQTLLITPVAFPLSVGGTTIAISVASAAMAEEIPDLVALSAMGVLFGAVVGITCYVGSAIPGRVGPTGRTIINRAAGVLLTAIGLSLLVTNVTKMMVEAGLSIG